MMTLSLPPSPQEHSSEHHSAGESAPHHIQVIAPDHSAQVDDSTHTAMRVYYPNRYSTLPLGQACHMH